MTFSPRAWQIKARDAFRNHTGPLGAMVVAATGGGKTMMALYCALDHLARGERVLMLSHRKELASQPLAALRRHFPQYDGGIVRAQHNACDKQIVFASKDTLKNQKRLDQYLSYGWPTLVIVDEAHISVTPAFKKVIEALRRPDVKFLGLTATPDRNDTLRLTDLWDIVFTYGILDGIKDKCLVPPFAVYDPLPHLDLSNAPMQGGDYEPAELERLLIEGHIVEHTVAALTKSHIAERLPFRDEVATIHPEHQGILVFTVTVAQAEATSAALNTAGIIARVVCGETPDAIRARLLDAFQRGEVDCLVSPAALTVGTDLPRAKVVVFARPTKSWVLFLQATGRVLRSCDDAPDKALLIDLCGASKEHSIVSAPVLVDGNDCPVSDDGAHHYLAIEGSHEGRCQDCGQLIKCYANRGGHLFPAKVKGKPVPGPRVCKHCKAPQCPDSPDLGHHFIPWEDHKRVCIHCAMEIPDPMAAMLDRTLRAKEPVLWKRLNVPGEVYAVDLGKVGVMFNVRKGDEFRPYLFSREKLTPLAHAPVSAQMARALTDDVARRTVKKGSYYGGKDSQAAVRIVMTRASDLARRLNLTGGE